MLTLLYSSSHFSSSEAASHLFILSIISFLPKASSFALTIWASIFARSSEGSTRPDNQTSWEISRKLDKTLSVKKLISERIPESINALVFSGAVLMSGSTWALLHISSSSDLLFRTSSFNLLAFSFVSLSTSASVCQNSKKNLSL